MKAVISGNLLLSSTAPEVTIEHNGETLGFSVSVFGRVSFQKDFEVFDQINNYWADQPVEVQAKIFNLYKDIHMSYEDIQLYNDLTAFISDKITQLYEIISYQSVHDWMMFRGNLIVPTYLEDDYKASIDNNTSREKTYTKKDYVELMVLSLSLRCMVPLWGEYIANTRREKGTHFKEFYAFQLLNKTQLMKTQPMTKLMSYVENIVGIGNKFRPDNTLRWIASDDFNYWLLAIVCVKKLSVCDIRGIDPDFNPISHLYKYIKQKVDCNDNNFEKLYKEKTFSEGAGDVESKLSSLEMYKIKTNISPGEIVELEYSLSDIYTSATKLTSLLDIDSFNKCLETSHILMNHRIQEPQLILLSWVFKPVISPRGLMYLSKPTIVRALGALEAVLWARGHEYLAIIASAYAKTSDRDMVVSPVDSKTRTSPELLEELQKYYPFTKPTNSKKKNNHPVNSTSLIIESIDNLADQLTMYSWKSTAAESKLRKVFKSTSKRMPIKPDIKNHITKLVIELGNRQYI